MESDALPELALALQVELERRSTFLETEDLNVVATVVRELGGTELVARARAFASSLARREAAPRQAPRGRHVRRFPLCVYVGDPRIAICASSTANFVRERHAEDCVVQQVPEREEASTAAALFGRVIGFYAATRALNEEPDLHPALAVFLETDGHSPLLRRAPFPARDFAHQVFDALKARDADELSNLYHAMVCSGRICVPKMNERPRPASCRRLPAVASSWARWCFRSADRSPSAG